jgi:uncharacterized protein (DUF4415 family)
MNAKNSKKTSKTDWARIDGMTDKMIDTSEVPPLDDSFFSTAKLRLPGKKVSIKLNVDADILEWFKAQNTEYENLINAALRIYADAHKEYTG